MRTKFTVSLSVATALAFSSLAYGEEGEVASDHTFSANVGVYSQYVFRGLTQTNEEPALQGGFDYSHASGFYAGTWLSNISWVSDVNLATSSSVEWDGYLGYKKTWGEGISTDIGYLRYQYPGSYSPGVLEPNTDELYVGVGWKWATLKYSHAVSDLFGVPDSEGSSYLDLTVAIPLPQGFGLSLHAGQQTFEGSLNDDLLSYEDYKATLSYGFGNGWTVAGSLTTSSAEDAGYTILGKNIGDDQFILSISRAL